MRPFKAHFPFNFEELETGFKYLGFFLKTSMYRACDWCWLLKKIEKKISNWCFRWLSLGGRSFKSSVGLLDVPCSYS
jgi:hypothetical protein